MTCIVLLTTANWVSSNLLPIPDTLKVADYDQFWHNIDMSRLPSLPDLPMRPLFWVGPSKEELKVFPEPVRRAMGFALHEAQTGGKPDNAKPLHGFGGAGVLEVVEDYDGDTYRAVYTVNLAGAVYVLHCFQKKSRRGSETPKQTMDLIRQRLRAATAFHEAREGREG